MYLRQGLVVLYGKMVEQKSSKKLSFYYVPIEKHQKASDNLYFKIKNTEGHNSALKTRGGKGKKKNKCQVFFQATSMDKISQNQTHASFGQTDGQKE